MNLSSKQKLTHRHREQTFSCQEGSSKRRKDWEFGISKYKLLYIGWISNKVLYTAQGTMFSLL